MVQWETLLAHSSRDPDSILTSGYYPFSVHVLPMSGFLPFPKKFEDGTPTVGSFQTEVMIIYYKGPFKMIIFEGKLDNF